jgi:isopenicillin-N N-acyltransferase-like protein
VTQFPHIRVSGSAIDRGRQVGRQAAGRIRRSIDIYREIFFHYAAWSWDMVTEHAEIYRPAIEAYNPQYLAEIVGMADGAGVAPVDVLAINVRTEIMFAAVARRAAQECTAVVALPEATVSGHTLIAQNWDWKPQMSDTVIVLEAEQDQGPNFVTVVEAGLLAKTGFNSAGIGLVTNALVTDQDRGQPGVPYHVILRGILDAETMSDALGAITGKTRASAANYLIAHREGSAVNVEAAPGDFSRVYMDFPDDNGTFAHTNHYTNTAFNLKDVALWDGPSSPFRLHRMQQFLKRGQGKVTPGKLGEFFNDHHNYPSSICRHPDPRVEVAEQYATVASVVMDLNAQTMWVANGNPCAAPYHEFNYGELLNKSPSFFKSDARNLNH